MLKKILLATTFIISIHSAYAGQIQLRQLGGIGVGVATGLANNTNGANGMAVLNGSGYIPGSIFPALSGDCTSTSGSLVLSCTKTGGVNLGSLATLNAAPAGTLTGSTLANSITNASITSFSLPTGVYGNFEVSSINTGHTNSLEFYNLGDSSNTSTISQIYASIGGNDYVTMYTSGGANPSAQIGTGIGVTGGFNVYSGAGPLQLTGASVGISGNTSISGNLAVTGFLSANNLPYSVSNNAALKNISISGLLAGTIAIREGFSFSGDSQAINYTLSLSACYISGGDNISEVAPNTGTGCWLWVPPPGGITPMSAGAAGNGSTLDTTSVQAASEAAAYAGIPLRFGPPYIYKVGTINFDVPGDWEGPYRYGAWSTTYVMASGCPWGLKANSTSQGDMILATAVTGTIRGVCIDATGGNPRVQASAGAGINLHPATTSLYQTGWTVELNTIFQPYDGIDVNGAGYSANCCGAGSAADGVNVSRNTIMTPARYGISNGLYTAGGATVGITYWDNTINCGNNSGYGLTRASAGFVLFDGGITYDGTNNGPEGCQVGFQVAPGAIYNGSGYTAQNAQVVAHGVFGDQSTVHDMLVQPTAASGVGGIVDFMQLDGIWNGATGNVQSVLLNCSTSGTACHEITFNDAVVHGGAGTTGTILSVVSGIGGPYNLTIAASNICQFGNPGSGATALGVSIGAGSSGHISITGGRIGSNCGGGGSADTNAINLSINSSASGKVIIEGVDLSSASNPLVYTPNTTDSVVIKNNLGIDDVIGSLSAASSILIPAQANSYGITGSATITDMSGGWSNRSVTLIAASGTINFTTGGTSGTKICNAMSITNPNSIVATFNAGWQCWMLK